MRFSEVLSTTKVIATNIVNFDFCIGKICSDTEKIKPGDIFVCRCGVRQDAHDYIECAHKLGAKAFVVEHVTPYLKKNPGIRYVAVKDTSLAEVNMLDCYYTHVAKHMKLIGITGTNGKTSSAYMLKAIFDAAGHKTGLISTIKVLAGDKDITCAKFNSMTTPSPAELYSYLSDMYKEGVDTVIMEASSHALVQKRLDALHFSLGIFTNLSEDHLDFHKNMQDYRNAKAHLFELCDKALINTDSPDGKEILSGVPCLSYSYSQYAAADFCPQNPHCDSRGTSFTLSYNGNKLDITCPLCGEFTLYNALAAASGAIMEGIDGEIIKKALANMPQIPGRLEKIDCGSGISVYIDFAHTPDALEKTLSTLKKLCTGRLITVFGCGGDREREKRPIMGRIATSVSDYTIITSDNPRNEEPQKIISEILCGVKRNADFRVIENRREAIHSALSHARNGDIVLLAGKGHENYEIVGKEKRAFSEREIIGKYFADINRDKK